MKAMFSRKNTTQPMNSQTKLTGCWELNLTLGGEKTQKTKPSIIT